MWEAHQTACEISFSRAHMHRDQRRNIRTRIIDTRAEIYHVSPRRAHIPRRKFSLTWTYVCKERNFRGDFTRKKNSYARRLFFSWNKNRVAGNIHSGREYWWNLFISSIRLRGGLNWGTISKLYNWLYFPFGFRSRWQCLCNFYPAVQYVLCTLISLRSAAGENSWWFYGDFVGMLCKGVRNGVAG